jgi:hypothetical protein
MNVAVHKSPAVTIVEVIAGGPPIATSRQASDLLSEAFSNSAEAILIPEAALAPAFFALKTGLAGEILQKFANYGRRVAIFGDISRYLAESEALRTFVRGADHGGQVFFVADREAGVAALVKAFGG